MRKVHIKNGWIRGTTAADPRITVFKGIPFAAPPIGKLRWREPQPCENWEGVLDCLEFAPISMQSIPGINKENIYTREWNVDPEIPMSEDCLYLNIWTPDQTGKEKLPVFIWFFGGALQWGNTAEMEFDGERIARRGIVVVTVNYRLNVFGFLAHPELKKENPKTRYNFGNLDQQAGVLWTKENIETFGGDPENITIGGQSAGGGSVASFLNSSENNGLVKRAIIESGIFINPIHKIFEISKEEAIAQSIDFFHYLGVNSIDEARALSAEYIRDKNDTYGKFWGTIVDGNYQQETYWQAIKKKQFPDIPLLMGWTTNEFREEGFCTIELGVRKLCQMKQKLGYLSPDYLYEFGPEIPGDDTPGAFHSSDLWFFFETLAKCWRPFEGIHYDLSRKMCNYWCNFIKSGDPNGIDQNGDKLDNWISYTDEKKTVISFKEKIQLQENRMDEKIHYYLEKVEL